MTDKKAIKALGDLLRRRMPVEAGLPSRIKDLLAEIEAAERRHGASRTSSDSASCCPFRR